MTMEQVRPPIAPKIDVRRNPLTWLAKEFQLYKQLDMLDGALFFDTSVAALALDETSYLEKYLNQGTPVFKHHERSYTVVSRHLPGARHNDTGEYIQGNFGEKDSWPKLRWSSFEMSVYNSPPSVEAPLEAKDLIRKITVEQSRSGKSRRIILQGRNTPNGPWISATAQFDLDPQAGYEPKAKLQGVAINWTDHNDTEWGISFKPKFNEKNSDFNIHHVVMHRRLKSAPEGEFEDMPLDENHYRQIMDIAHNSKIGGVKLELRGVKVNLPIPLELLKKVKFPTSPPQKLETDHLIQTQ